MNRCGSAASELPVATAATGAATPVRSLSFEDRFSGPSAAPELADGPDPERGVDPGGPTPFGPLFSSLERSRAVAFTFANLSSSSSRGTAGRCEPDAGSALRARLNPAESGAEPPVPPDVGRPPEPPPVSPDPASRLGRFAPFGDPAPPPVASDGGRRELEAGGPADSPRFAGGMNVPPIVNFSFDFSTGRAGPALPPRASRADPSGQAVRSLPERGPLPTREQVRKLSPLAPRAEQQGLELLPADRRPAPADADR